MRVLAFAATQEKSIQDFIATSSVIENSLEHCIIIKGKLPIPILRLLVNCITQNVENQDKYLEKVLSNSNLFSIRTPECYKFSLMALYNSFVINPKLIHVILTNKQVLNWYKASFDFLQHSKSVGIENEAEEKEYAELYEWLVMLTFFLMKLKQSNLFPLNALFSCLLNEEMTIYTENNINLIRNSSENDTVIQPSLLQSRFIQFMCSEVILQIKEGQDNQYSENTINFMCSLLKTSITAFKLSYDILKIWSDSFLSANFKQDFQNLIDLLTVTF